MKVKNEPVRIRLRPVPYYGSRRHLVVRTVFKGALWAAAIVTVVVPFVFFFVAPWLR